MSISLPEDGSPAFPYSTLRRLIRFARPYWKWLGWATLCMLGTASLNLIPPWLTKEVIDDVIQAGHWEQLPLLAAILFGVYLVRAVTNTGESYWSHIVSEKLIHDLRVRVYTHLQRLTTRFYRDERTGELMSRVVNDIDSLRDMFAHSGHSVITQGITVVGITVLLFVMHVKLALLTLLPIPLMVLLTWWASRRVRGLYRVAKEKLATLNARLNDNLSGMEVIRSFAREPEEQERFRQASAEYQGAMIRGVLVWAWLSPLLQFMIGVASIIILWYGGLQVRDGAITLGVLVAYMSYIWRLYWPISEVSRETERIQQGLAAGDRILELCDEPVDIVEAPHAQPLDTVEGEVVFHDVCFQYRDGEPVLDHLHLQVASGETVGLVGLSGAGKTTVVNLLLRFYDPQHGSLSLDGRDLRQLPLRWLRQQIGLVPQETFLFNTTIAENLAYGRPAATREEIVQAAQVANIHEFIASLPEGYDTLIGERGLKLSGGQRQRLALARAVLIDPPLLILDEATSSVDTESEQLIQQSLEHLLPGRTTIIIAHRLATLQVTDRIIVLQEGHVAESGDQEWLLAQNGLYRRLHEAQSVSVG